MEDHSRQELLEEYFSSSGVGAPEGVEGFIWLKVSSLYLIFFVIIQYVVIKCKPKYTIRGLIEY